MTKNSRADNGVILLNGIQVGVFQQAYEFIRVFALIHHTGTSPVGAFKKGNTGFRNAVILPDGEVVFLKDEFAIRDIHEFSKAGWIRFIYFLDCIIHYF